MLQDITALIAGLTAFGVTHLLLPPVVEFAERRRLVGVADGARIVDDRDVPRAGGLAVWFGFTAAVAVGTIASGFFFVPEASQAWAFSQAVLIAVMAGASVAVVLGFLDDLRPLGATQKFVIQCLAALPVAASTDLTSGLSSLTGLGPAEAGVVTLLWILFVMNSINLIDGLDGLAAGIVIIATAFLVLIAGFTGWPLVLAVALVGSLLGLLRYNLPPARVFMGDTGSLLIGYVLAILGLAALQASPSMPRLIAVLVVLGLPGLDTLTAIIRRTIAGRNPFRPDVDHLHHRLLDRANGLHSRATLTFYLIGIALGVFGLLANAVFTAAAIAVFMLVVLFALVLCADLGYFDRASYQRMPGIRPGIAAPTKRLVGRSWSTARTSRNLVQRDSVQPRPSSAL